MTAPKQLDQDLIEHACAQLGKAARQHVRDGMGPASAAWAAIRATRALFPPDWKLAVQGDDNEEWVEVWEAEHKRSVPCARVVREAVTEAPGRQLTKSQRQQLAIIQDHGGRVRRSWLGGWLNGVRGLRLPVVEQLVKAGFLTAETEKSVRRTTRSKGMLSSITTYKIVEDLSLE